MSPVKPASPVKPGEDGAPDWAGEPGAAGAASGGGFMKKLTNQLGQVKRKILARASPSKDFKLISLIVIQYGFFEDVGKLVHII